MTATPHADRFPVGWALVVLALSAWVLLVGLGKLPLQVWDESRLANSAIEMAHSGLSLVPTYGGQPDHYSTKPPLAIWLMAISIHAIGPSEVAVRLPSALAGIATTMAVFAWTWYRLRRVVPAVAVALVLFSGAGYVHSHAARSGEYDVLLTLWTTLMLIASFEWLHAGEARQRRAWLAAATAAVVLAFLTKASQGMVFVPAILLYGVLVGRLGARLKEPATWVAALSAVTVGVGYYALREAVDPGSFAVAWFNDWIGRIGTVLEGHEGGPLTYVLALRPFPLLGPSLAAAAWLAWTDRGERRRMAAFLGIACGFYLLVISAGRTKLPWYVMPLYPPVSVLAALLIDRAIEAMRRRARPRPAVGVALLAAAVIAVGAANTVRTWRHDSAVRADDLHAPGYLLRDAALRAPEVRSVAVLHPGFSVAGDYYTAPIEFYAKVLARSGVAVHVLPPDSPLPAGADHAVACGDVARASALAAAQVVRSAGRCLLLRLASGESRAKPASGERRKR